MGTAKRRLLYVFYGICIWSFKHYTILSDLYSGRNVIYKRIEEKNITKSEIVKKENVRVRKVYVNNTAIIERLKEIPNDLSVRNG